MKKIFKFNFNAVLLLFALIPLLVGGIIVSIVRAMHGAGLLPLPVRKRAHGRREGGLCHRGASGRHDQAPAL